MAILAAAIIFAGFARTYYLKELFGTPSLPLLLHIHGLLMSAWLALFITQTFLVATHRVQLHRRLGVLGAMVALAIIPVGVLTAIHAVRLGHAPTGASPLSFLAIPLGDIAVFGTLVAAALYYRRRPDLHKRLMLVATITILPPGIARWPVTFVAHVPLMFFGLTDLVLIGCVLYDWAKTRRLHPAFLWGGLLLLASHPLRLMISGTGAWLSFARWLTGA